MTMWLPLDKTAAYGEDPARPTEFIWHVPEYDAEGNLIAGDPDYYRNDPPPKGHSAGQGGMGLNTSIKGSDIERPGPAEFLRGRPSLDSPGHWGPELAGELGEGFEMPPGEPGSYPYPSSEQLKKDTHFALGPGRSFQWPGGLESAEKGHNLVASHGFDLENSGTDDEPIPTYRHITTDARIEPSGDEDAPWSLHSPFRDNVGEAYGTTSHASAAAAAMAHKSQYDESATRASQRSEYNSPSRPSRGYHPYDDGGYSRSRTPRRTRGIRGSRPTNVDDAMRHAVSTASYLTGEDAPNASWDLRNEGTTFGGHPSHLHTGTGWLENWVADQYHNDLASGKVQHVIYHHQTPLAWMNSEPDENSSGGEKHTWVIPDQFHSNTSSRRQRAIKNSVHWTNHSDAIEEPYDPDRGFPGSHHRGPHPASEISNLARSHHAQDTVNNLNAEGFSRPGNNSRQHPVFIRPTVQTREERFPGETYSYPYTRTRGVYMRPVDGPHGPSWVVGEHDNGTNKVQGSKRLDSLDDALTHAERVHQWIKGGAQGQPPAIADRQDAAWRRGILRRRGPGAPIPRTPEINLPGQEELPLHTLSVFNWSEFLRNDGEVAEGGQ